MIKIRIIGCFMFCVFLAGFISAQEKTKKKTVEDTSGSYKYLNDTSKVLKTPADSLTAKNTSGIIDTLKKDTTIKYIPISGLDKLSNTFYMSDTISSKEIMFSDHFTFKDILSSEKGFYIADFGIPGQVNPFLFEGLNDRYVNIFVDGVLVENSVFGKPDHLLIPSEEIEKIEFLSSSESFMYGSGSALKSINIITAKHYDSKPYTSLRHIEAPFSTYMTDAVFTQNISKNTNIFAGFNYHVSGSDVYSERKSRYWNSDYSYINARLRLRFNLSNKINLLISDYYYKNNRSLNGGMDYNYITENWKNMFDERSTYDDVNLSYAEETHRKNDITLTLGGRFFEDSTNITKMNLAFISERREYNDKADSLNPFQGVKSTNIRCDISQSFSLPENVLYFNAGFNYQLIIFDSVFQYEGMYSEVTQEFKDYSRIQLYVSLKNNIRLGRYADVNVFGRYNYFMDEISPTGENNSSGLAIGLYNELHISKNLIPFFEGSLNMLNNSIMENIRKDFYVPIREESNLYFAAGTKYSNDYMLGDFIVFYRKLIDPVSYIYNQAYETHKPVMLSPGKQEIYGMSLKAKGNYWKINASLKLDYNNNRYDDKTFILYPEWYSESEIYFSDTIFTKDIRLKFGLSAKCFSEYRGQYYYPEINALGDYGIYRIPDNIVINFLAVLKIQTAILYFTIENVFNKDYMLTPYYPMNGRSFKFAVSWSFMN